MTVSSFVRIASAVALVAGAVAVTGYTAANTAALAAEAKVVAKKPAPPAGPTCGKKVITAAGNLSTIQYLASVSSKNAWKAAVAADKKYGAGYATFGNAKDKGVNCKKEKAGAPWKCTATGKPCTA